MRRALPLSFQLLLIFVGLLVGVVSVLTTSAYTSLRDNLEGEALRHVGLATQSREQMLSQLFQLRQQRAEGFLVSLQSLCAEPLDSGRLAWVGECVRPMVDDFRRSERALGAEVTYRTRRISRSGERVSTHIPAPGALATTIHEGGEVEYVMKAVRRHLAIALQFDNAAVAALFDDVPTHDRAARLSLLEGTACRPGADAFVAADSGGRQTFQSYRRVATLGTTCVHASLPYETALAPANTLREELIRRGGSFILVGIVLSLVAARWVSAPVRRLAASARTLPTGHFDRPLSLGGPSEVQALERAFNAMANDLEELVSKEQAARREAEDANRTKDEFLATVSHELRTPLTAVMGWAHMLRTQPPSAERLQHGLEVIERSARAQSRLIDDLLDVSRIASNRLRILREPVRLDEVITAALDTVGPQAQAKNIDVLTRIDESATVLGDARRLEQVVCNLVWNAIKFTEPSGTIVLHLRRDGEDAVLSVTDTGVGISSSFLPYVFEWFRQADPRSRSQSGLGLGLGIVRHIVQLHGGRVRADSGGTGQGATFTVTLPAYTPATSLLHAGGEDSPAHRKIAHRLDAARVLVVEDDADARELVKVTLESAGASVDTVACASEARREVLADAPDVLISDIRMPDEDGYALMRSLRSAGIVTPAIALTAYARREDAEQARAAGYQIHLPKPVDAARLVDAVAELLGHP